MCLTRAAEVLETDGCTAQVRLGGRVITVDTGPLDGPVSPGEFVAVYAGWALERLDPALAAELELLMEELRGDLPGESDESEKEDAHVSPQEPPIAR